MIAELLGDLTRAIVDEPDAVTVTPERNTEDGSVVLELRVDEGDYGKVIGRGGRTAKALRQVMTGVGGRGLRVDVVDTDGRWAHLPCRRTCTTTTPWWSAASAGPTVFVVWQPSRCAPTTPISASPRARCCAPTRPGAAR